MNQEEILNELQKDGCVAVYTTGSTANPYIKKPRDTEFYAVFGTYEEAKNAKKIYNVHNISKDWTPNRLFIWQYLHHYLNKTDSFTGEKCQFAEPTIEQLVAMANGMISSEKYKKNIPAKLWYHVAMVKAIEKYGYDNIPEKVVSQINDLHDLKIAYDQFRLE